jgi:hypothetical protein
LLDSVDDLPSIPSSDSHYTVVNQVFGNSPRSSQPSGNSNLHSPLLDNHSPAPDNTNIRPDVVQNSNKPSRLHSPVLDGPGQNNRGFESNELDTPIEEYNSLRSPILGAKVPLPEPPRPAPDPVIKPSSVNVPIPPSKQPTIQSLFGPVTGSQPVQSEESYKQFASSLFDKSPLETSEKAFVPPPRDPAASFTTITGIKKKEERQDIAPITTPIKPSKSISGGGLLPSEEEFSGNTPRATQTSGSGFKVTGVLFLSAALVCKFWYCAALGTKALLSSPPFLADQVGQVLIILLFLILVLTTKL